jgi:hypothetical protein
MPRYWHEIQGGTWTNVDQTADHFELKANTDEDRLRALAASGDLVFSISPATTGSSTAAVLAAIAGTAGKYTRVITMKLVTAAGEVHTWYSGVKTVGVAENAAGANAIEGTLTSTSVKFVNGVATATLAYTGTWAEGNVSTFTLTGGTTLGYTTADKTSVDTLVA